ncbi:MAG: hypothetical protein ACYTGS_12180 [Planctomycetota bacterium]|jgi:hypothetical protein
MSDYSQCAICRKLAMYTVTHTDGFTRCEECIGKDPPQSAGHIAFVDGFEYFTSKAGLHRARVSTTYIMQDGYRSGSRWICPAHMGADYLSQAQGETTQ